MIIDRRELRTTITEILSLLHAGHHSLESIDVPVAELVPDIIEEQ